MASEQAKVSSLQPDHSKSHSPSYLDQAQAALQRGNIAELETCLLAWTQQQPDSSEPWSHLGYFYWKQNRPLRALDALERRNQLASPDGDACWLLYCLYAQVGDWKQALRWLNCAQQAGFDSRKAGWHRLRTKWRLFFSRCTNFLPQWHFQQSWLAKVLFHFGRLSIALLETCAPSNSQSTNPFSLSKYLDHLYRYHAKGLNASIPYHKNREALFASRNLPIHEPTSLILDLGTGRNALPFYWATQGCTVVALDGDDYGFSVLQQEARRIQQEQPCAIHLTLGDVTTLPFADAQFDGVSSICMIEHIPGEGDKQAMAEILRVLRPGGIAAVTVESAEIPNERWLAMPYEIGYQRQEAHHESRAQAVPELFCRDYSREQIQQRLIEPFAWQVVEQGWFDDTGLPWRSWLDGARGAVLLAPFRPLQPLLSMCFYRPVPGERRLSPSSIGYLVLRKPEG